MADSWKSMDLNKFVVKDDMIDYVLHKYGSYWQVHDAIADNILDDLLKRELQTDKQDSIPWEFADSPELSGERRTTHALGDIGNLVPARIDVKIGKPLKRPITVSYPSLDLSAHIYGLDFDEISIFVSWNLKRNWWRMHSPTDNIVRYSFHKLHVRLS
ncbi:hypothetical protein Tco_0661888 [Tanacetum coccineum]